MPTTWRAWTEEEDAFLVENYHALGEKECGRQLDRTYRAVEKRVARLKLGRKLCGWGGKRIRQPKTAPVAQPLPAPPPPKPAAVYDSGFIRPPSLARLMGGKA